MSDKYGFKNAFLAMAGLQALTLACYDKLAGSKLTFALGTMSVYFTLGGAYVCFLFLLPFGGRGGWDRAEGLEVSLPLLTPATTLNHRSHPLAYISHM